MKSSLTRPPADISIAMTLLSPSGLRAASSGQALHQAERLVRPATFVPAPTIGRLRRWLDPAPSIAHSPGFRIRGLQAPYQAKLGLHSKPYTLDSTDVSALFSLAFLHPPRRRHSVTKAAGRPTMHQHLYAVGAFVVVHAHLRTTRSKIFA